MRAKKYTRETIALIGVREGVSERNFPDFKIGDAIEVAQRIKEGDKERIQIFEGDVIAIKNSGISRTFIVRRIGASGVSVERIFPYYSPFIQSIKILRRGKVRRAKLYYMRERIGKAARVKERILTKEQKNVVQNQNNAAQ